MKLGRVLYDHQAFEMQRFGGISNYFHELIRHIGMETELSLFLSNNYYRKDACRIFVPSLPYKWFKSPIKAINRWYSLRKIASDTYDLFHPTYYHPYFLKEIGKKPYVLTVHDLNHELFPHLFPNAAQLCAWKKEVIGHAAHVIAISENTRRDLLRFYPLDPQRITVVYHGVTSFNPLVNRLDLPERYLLYVGARGGYKNFDRLLLAFQQVAKRDDTLQLICVGKPFKPREWQYVRELGIAGQLRPMQVGEDDLGQLYRQALLFVYPSLYEGFGMPILEAYANHCPVALSHASCFPEIAGEAGAYFDPESVDSIRTTIEMLLQSEAKRTTLVTAGEERLQRYSWEKTAARTQAVYERLINSK